jgi:hypothetical protein
MRVDRSSVDQFTTPIAFEQFGERQAAGLTAIRANGLIETSVVIGGMGLAAQGLDTYVENKSPFDVDLVVSGSKITEMSGWAEQTPEVHIGKNEFHFDDAKSGMPMSVMSTLPPNLKNVSGANCYEDLVNMAVVTDSGIATLPATRLAQAKLGRTSVKDISGIVKAHVVAHAAEHEVINDSDWQFAVKRAMHYASLRISRSSWLRPSGFPAWMGRLAATNFDHPAFRSNPNPALGLRAV